MLERVPVPGGATLRVPSAAIVTFAPALTPPILEPCGGSRESVPATVIEPPVVDPFVESPGPAVTDVKVPPRADATFITPYWSIETPLPKMIPPVGVEIWFDGGE
jgi:hypothetical protein